MDDLAEWIDTEVIADAIGEELIALEIEPSVANGKRVWLSFLESELHEGLRSTINALWE